MSAWYSLMCMHRISNVFRLNFKRGASSLLAEGRCFSQSKTVSSEEVQKFSEYGAEWWKEDGKFSLLLEMNRPRINYIRKVVDTFVPGAREGRKVEVLDVGCGGGLASESLARLGYSVTGIDLNEKSIFAAREHAKMDPLVHKNVNYIQTSPEDLMATKREYYDVVCSLEVIEHVDNQCFFVRCLNDLLKPGGVIILSTMNRSIQSALVTVVLAEYILGWVDRGTHDVRKYIRPREMVAFFNHSGCTQLDISSLTRNITNREWTVGPPIFADPCIGYIVAARKNH